ncbi:MAG: hypothetical protein HN348_04770 [Proteobacteria bacterium]|nr:hypothetical protein [Pseudomonadota bacterium]
MNMKAKAELQPSTAPWLAIIGLFHAMLVYWYWFVCDDSYISFRYSRNWASGIGIRYNAAEEIPIEGYSNFLWMAIGAVVEWARLDVALVMPLASAFCGLVLLAYFFWTLWRQLGLAQKAALLATAGLALAPPFFVWSTSGLATMPFALAFFGTFERLVISRHRWSWLHGVTWALLMGLLRTEGIFWALTLLAVFVTARVVETKSTEPGGPGANCGVDWRRMGQFMATLLVAYGAYLLWKHSYFHTIIANTAHAKVSLGWPRIWRGICYVIVFHLTFVTPVFLVLSGIYAARSRKAVAVVALVMWVGFSAYAALIGGDYMTFFRLFVPGLPFLMLLFALLLDELWQKSRQIWLIVGAIAMIVIALLPAFDFHAVPLDYRAQFPFRLRKDDFHSEREQWKDMVKNTDSWRKRGLALKQVSGPDDSFVAAAIGAVGYFSEISHLYDRNGLVDREVALMPAPEGPLTESPGHDKTVDRNFFLDQKPTIIEAKLIFPPEVRKQIRQANQQWRHKPTSNAYVWDNYLPDFAEVEIDGETGMYLMVLRLRQPEDPSPAEIEETWFQRTFELPK